MDNKPSIDRSFFIPILLGVFSVLGICLVLIASRLSAARGNLQSADTATPLKYQYIGTEPGVVLPTEAASPTDSLTALEPTSNFVLTAPAASATKPPVSPISESTSSIQTISTNTSTPNIDPTAEFLLDVLYDDTDPRFLYSGNWASQNNVTDAFQNTLHVSSTIGDAVQFSFVGQQIQFTYQVGPDLGAIAIKMDGVDFALDQSAPDVEITDWQSPVLVLSSHAVTITHISGASINVDSISVVDLSTETPAP